MSENTTYLKEIRAEGYTGHNSEHPFWMVEQGAKSDELFINWQRASGKRGSRICRVWNGPVDRAANANLLAAAPKMAAEIDTLRASLAAVTKERDEARKYGAPVGDAVAFVKKKKPCEHNDYWVTNSGHCMACRATEAESRLAIAVEALSTISQETKRCMSERNDDPNEWKAVGDIARSALSAIRSKP